jgi:membrane-associated protease RseP (regulator of RpoE activity)
MGGFITIAKIFPNEWDWWAFWEKTAFISLVLAFMNILPIPALDGGHVMFLIWGSNYRKSRQSKNPGSCSNGGYDTSFEPTALREWYGFLPNGNRINIPFQTRNKVWFIS